MPVPSKLIETVTRYRQGDRSETAVPRLWVWSSDRPTPPAPALFEPKFYMVLQGAKQLTIAEAIYNCHAGSCAIASLGLPFSSAVVEATSARPYLAVELKFDVGIIAELLASVPHSSERLTRAITFGDADEKTMGPLGRLVDLLDAPADIPALAPSFERELYFRLLQSPIGVRLRQIGQQSSRFRQIKLAADWIGENASTAMSVAWLAAYVGMSVTSFHRHFKAVTGYSPLAYQRHIRLADARRRLVAGVANVTETAFASGYNSASQFSREYKAAFGKPPVQDAALLRP